MIFNFSSVEWSVKFNRIQFEFLYWDVIERKKIYFFQFSIFVEKKPIAFLSIRTSKWNCVSTVHSQTVIKHKRHAVHFTCSISMEKTCSRKNRLFFFFVHFLFFWQILSDAKWNNWDSYCHIHCRRKTFRYGFQLWVSRYSQSVSKEIKHTNYGQNVQLILLVFRYWHFHRNEIASKLKLCYTLCLSLYFTSSHIHL